MEETSNLVTKVASLSGAIDENFLELAKALRELQDQDVDEFTRLVNNSPLGRRKAYYLVAIDRTFSKIPVPKARLKRIGWTKLNVLTKSINKSNYAELLKAAETYTAKELEKYLAGEKPATDKKAFLAYLTPEAYETLTEAFHRVGGRRYQRGWSNKGAALTALAQTVANLPKEVLDKYGVIAEDVPD